MLKFTNYNNSTRIVGILSLLAFGIAGLIVNQFGVSAAALGGIITLATGNDNSKNKE